MIWKKEVLAIVKERTFFAWFITKNSIKHLFKFKNASMKWAHENVIGGTSLVAQWLRIHLPM